MLLLFRRRGLPVDHTVADMLTWQPIFPIRLRIRRLFHPYRRLWATERKHMPDVDVTAAGGWKDTQALRLSYQHADPATVLRVVEGG